MSALADEIEAAVRKVFREEMPRLLAEQKAPAANDGDCYTVASAASLAKMNDQTIRERCRSGEIDAFHPGGGRGWRIPAVSFHAWLRKGQPESKVVDIDAEARKIARGGR